MYRIERVYNQRHSHAKFNITRNFPDIFRETDLESVVHLLRPLKSLTRRPFLIHHEGRFTH